MRHEVKMPQLGMAQDSGVIVAWLKSVGDAVVAGDALFEVETDKATMEVEAQTSGFLAGVRAKEGDDVPVGDVIALIVQSETEVAAHADEVHGLQAEVDEPAPAQDVSPQSKPVPSAEEASAAKPFPVSAPSAPIGRVRASPKARRLALEQGIDLSVLRAQGVKEPIRAADLAHATSSGQSVLTAEVPGTALDALLDHSRDTSTGALLAAFASGAWRGVFKAEAAITLRGLDGTSEHIGREDTPAVLTLVDLCDTRLASYVPAGGGTTLSVGRRGESYTLTLSFSEATLPMPYSVALLDDFAARIEEPIRQLL